MTDATKRLWKIGAGLYVAWGLLHVVVGAPPLARLAVSGPASMLSFYEFDLETVDGPMLHASHLIAEHAAGLIGFGLMAVIVAVALVAKGRASGYWLNALVLGIVDLAFVTAEIVPGHVSAVETGIGPLLYVAALAVTTVALVRDRRHRPASPAADVSSPRKARSIAN